MTVAELIREIRKPGKVSLPVLTAHDVLRMPAEKSTLLAYLAHYAPDEIAPWYIVRRTADGLELDVND